MRNLDWPEIQNRIRSRTSGEISREEFPQLLPKKTKVEAQQQVENILSAAEVLRSGLRPSLASLDLFALWWRRLQKKATLQPLELRDCRMFCLELLALREALKEHRNEWALATLGSLMDASKILKSIDAVITPRGEIRRDASSTLDQLFTEKESLAKTVKTQLDRLVNAQEMERTLQDRYVTTREGRWVLPIRSGQQHWVQGLVHGSSQTKQTVFIEPEVVVPLNNRLRAIEVEIEAEIERILIELSLRLIPYVDHLEKANAHMQEVDRLLSLAQFHLEHKSNRFRFADEAVALVQVFHPLLLEGGKTPVPNSVTLKKNQSVLLLSGPNAGGKTVLLKSIGLACQMARCGLPICASEESALPFFHDIVAIVGDAQNVASDLSTFAAHVQQLQVASEKAGPETLILVDEICGSTDPEEGAALSRSLIEHFAQTESFAVITSHLSQLKSGWDSTILCGSMDFDGAHNQPTYQFLPGVVGESLALQTAQRNGLGKKLLDRALEFLSPSFKARLAKLDEVERMKEDLKLLRQHLESERVNTEKERVKLQKKLADFESEKESVLEKLQKQAHNQIDELIARAKTEQTFKKHLSLQDIKSQIPEIIKAKPAVSSGAPTTAEEFKQKFPPGARVYVPSLHSDAVVQSEPNHKGEVYVMSQSMRMLVDWQSLRPPQGQGNPTAQLLRRSGNLTGNISVSLTDEEKSIDVRGKTVSEALNEVEAEIDLCVRTQTDRFKVIHGFGTEALKKAIRSQLSRSPFVHKWTSGASHHGGDGVTWVHLSLHTDE